MKSFIGYLTALLISSAAMAESPEMKPGLWEHSIKFESESGRMEEAMSQLRQQMEAIPPQQRKMMEDMMKRQGVSFDFANQTFKNCLTQEDAQQGQIAISENEDCETTDKETSGDQTTFHFSCSGDEHSGEGTITFHNDTSYSGESTTTVDMQGEPEKMNVQHQGEWLGDDCGDLTNS